MPPRKKSKTQEKPPESFNYLIRLNNDFLVGYSLDARPQQVRGDYSLEVSGEILEPNGRAKRSNLLFQGSRDELEGSTLGTVHIDGEFLRGWIQLEGWAWSTIIQILNRQAFLLLGVEKYRRTYFVKSFQFATTQEGF